MLKQLLLLLSVFLLPSFLMAQDLTLEKVDGPSGFFFDEYIGEIEELAYVAYRVDYGDSRVFSFDETVFTELTAPADLSFSYVTGVEGDTYYLVYTNDYYDNSVVSLDETGLNKMFDIDPNGFFSGYEFTVNDLPYFTVFDSNFDEMLGFYDGSDFIPTALPNGLTFGAFLGTIDDVVYITLQDALNNDLIFAYDGSSFSALSMPYASPFLNAITQTEEGIYLRINDLNFDASLFFLDGTTLTLIPMPANFFALDGFVGSINDRLFFAFNDDYFNGTILELEAGNTWKEFPNPTNLFYLFSTGPTASDDFLYPVFANDYFINNMVVFDGTTDLKVVPNPAAREYSAYYRDFKQGHLVAYRDDYFDNHLYFYDQTDLTAVQSPAGFDFNRYSFQYKTKVYFSYYDNSFNQHLFSLNLNKAPLSADNTVTTEKETPYTFSTTDFDFSDEDMGDTFEAIELVSLPTKGILHVFGAQVSEGQVIGIGDLDKLNYLPLDDGIGEPYDNFTFKVSDGFSFSTETYTMYININPTVGVEETTLAAKLTIFPNPASDFVNIDLQDYASAQTIRISLLGANGQVLETKLMKGSQERLRLQGLPAGIYQLHFQNEEVKLTRGLIISK